MKESVYLFYSCNAWKEYSSMCLIGIARDKMTLYEMVGTKIKEGAVLYQSDHEEESWRQFLRDYKEGTICLDHLEYAYVTEEPVFSEKTRISRGDFPNIGTVRKHMRKVQEEHCQ